MMNMKSGINAIPRIGVLLLVLLALSQGTAAASTSVVLKFGVKYFDDAIDIASKISGKQLSSAERKLALFQLRNAAVKHGDKAILAARKGGLELISAAGKYGDDVWKFASKVPAGARALAMHTRELLPLTRRIGTGVLQLESKVPGLAKHVVKNFGDNGIGYFAKHVPAKDATRLVGFARRADTPATRQMLMNYYKKGGTRFLDKLDWKHIMAGGLSAAAITAAYQVGDGLQEGFKNISKSSPETAGKTASHAIDRLSLPIVVPATLLGLGLAGIWLFRYWRRSGRKRIRV